MLPDGITFLNKFHNDYCFDVTHSNKVHEVQGLPIERFETAQDNARNVSDP